MDNGEVAPVRKLLREGAPPNAYEGMDGSPIIFAAIESKRWDIVDLLVQAGAYDGYYGDDSIYDQSAVGELEAAGQKALADKLRQNGKL